ncbi:MAG: hypothetical protein ACKV22_01800 [Bryobacteraceae bacterium]
MSYSDDGQAQSVVLVNLRQNAQAAVLVGPVTNTALGQQRLILQGGRLPWQGQC